MLIACRSLRAVLGVVTCFTAAHSITLALAALDWIALPSRVVEPLIAATIVFIGVENLYRARSATTTAAGSSDEPPRSRYLLTFAFGLLHGFGFAMALRDIGLGSQGAPILLPLFGFNLGVELGQIAVAAVALPLLWRLRRVPLFARYGGDLAVGRDRVRRSGLDGAADPPRRAVEPDPGPPVTFSTSHVTIRRQ